ncbi:2-phospho-L-lactate transferase [Novosphingobium bradum]|uniref:2-phospho-L-lactate transferase n=1 Tax=Novosphingobium bradum TaxID=1737444 RepID=A0ABV7IML9_9SPHN
MIVVLAGGVGGARFANGLAALLGPGQLTVVVNVGDDFDHLGLRICPDLDTVTYTLANLNNRELGWGQVGETWSFMDALGKLGGPAWFNLGDRDLATHVLRTHRLAAGEPLSAIVADFAKARGIAQAILPVTDDPVRTRVLTDEGELNFQDYFVRRRCEPVFRAIRFAGADQARPHPAVLAALADPALEAILIAPSNPLLSLAPILAVPGIAAALAARAVPCVAISPFIAGQAVKGPAAKIMRELGLEPGPAAIAAHYGDLIDGLVIDHADRAELASPALLHTDILMRDDAGQQRLAAEVLAFARRLA